MTTAPALRGRPSVGATARRVGPAAWARARAFAGADHAWAVLVVLVRLVDRHLQPVGVAAPRPVRLVRLRHGDLRPGRVAAGPRSDVRHRAGPADPRPPRQREPGAAGPVQPPGRRAGVPEHLPGRVARAGRGAAVAARPPPVPLGLDRPRVPRGLPGAPVGAVVRLGAVPPRRVGDHAAVRRLVLPRDPPAGLGHRLPGLRGRVEGGRGAVRRGARRRARRARRPSPPTGRLALRRRPGRGRRRLVRHLHPGDPAGAQPRRPLLRRVLRRPRRLAGARSPRPPSPIPARSADHLDEADWDHYVRGIVGPFGYTPLAAPAIAVIGPAPARHQPARQPVLRLRPPLPLRGPAVDGRRARPAWRAWRGWRGGPGATDGPSPWSCAVVVLVSAVGATRAKGLTEFGARYDDGYWPADHDPRRAVYERRPGADPGRRGRCRRPRGS